MGVRRCAATIAVIALTTLFAVPATAFALTLQAPSISFKSVDVTVTLEASDPTGTVCVLAGGRVVASRLATPGSVVAFTGVEAGAGEIPLHAAVRHPGGIVYSAASTVTVWGVPGKPTLVRPAGGYAAAKTTVEVKPGPQTTSLTLFVNGVSLRTVEVTDGRVVRMAQVSLPKGTSTFKLIAANPLATAEYTFAVKRLDYPWPTCIIVDKSDFRLYWIRDGELVKAYPIAHGRVGASTPERNWRILAKYHTDPSSVYGPRKMRLFAQTSRGFSYTAYAIHGTSQPWAIGTRVSAGCIRMYNRDVLELFPQVPLGTMVQTRQ